MSEMDIEEAISRRPTTIIERKILYDKATRQHVFSAPRTISTPPKRKRDRRSLDIIRYLLSAKDLSANHEVPFPRPKKLKQELMIKQEPPTVEVLSSDESDCECFVPDTDEEGSTNQGLSPRPSHNLCALNAIIQAKKQRTVKIEATPPSPVASGTNQSDSGISSISSPVPRSDPGPGSMVFWEPPKLRCGETYLVPGKSDHRWVRATLLDLSNGLCSLTSVRGQYPIMVEQHNIAHPYPPKVPINIGSRVVALANRPASTGEISLGQRPHRKGVVAEFPEPRNKNRYLIIFEDGRWSHVKWNAVWPLDCGTRKVWQDLPEKSQKIVNDYLSGFYHPMIRYSRGDRVRKDSENVFGVILNLDSALAIVHFPVSGNVEIIHRGNRRFKPFV